MGLDLADLARRLTCATCRHSVTQHNDYADFCEEYDCKCLAFSPIAATGESNGERVDG